MASTTKTTNLELSQFVGTDKPTWLTDYNGDMHKIDNGYKKLEDANKATQADLDTTKQDLSGSQTDIDNVKSSVQALEAQDIALGNRLTVVEGNYDTMHHEVAVIENVLPNKVSSNVADLNVNVDNKKVSIGNIAYINFEKVDGVAFNYDEGSTANTFDNVKNGKIHRLATTLNDIKSTFFMQDIDNTGVIHESNLSIQTNSGMDVTYSKDTKAVGISFAKINSNTIHKIIFDGINKRVIFQEIVGDVVNVLFTIQGV